ncbi:HNH endonuclease family protein [Streptomyces sp. NPDC088745]|uniref:HNH endonuclease family protein n=1 Tax=Streptomyces sp. NPDC088745 TaxID=3365884 RepID=UPI00382D0449
MTARTSRSAWKAVSAAGLGAALLLGGVGCDAVRSGTGPGSGAGSGSGPGGTVGKPGSALAAVDDLAVKGRAPKTGYQRASFGRAWADTDDNGCGTRDDILKRDLKDVAFGDARKCKVSSGVLADDPYTGTRVEYRRGASKVDIDHLVALSDAWQKGAQQWSKGKRLAFANDPLNLLAAEASANRRKGDGDTATWLPPNKGYRCAYVASQVAVKKKYGLWVTPGERDAMKAVLKDCPRQGLPSGGNPTEAPAGR